MGCNCGRGGGNTNRFEVIKPDGSRVTVNTLSEAQALVRQS